MPALPLLFSKPYELCKFCESFQQGSWFYRHLHSGAVVFESGRKPCIATRKNMNRLMSEEQFQLLNSRNIIENVWSVLKLNYNLIYHRARSITGMFRHFFYSISAFLFHKAHEIRKGFSSKLCVLEKLEF